MPLLMTAITATPIMARPTEPLPPERLVPPNTVGGNGVHFIGVAGAGLAVLQLGGVEHAAHGRHNAADHMAQEGDLRRIDTAQVGHIAIGAGGIYVPAEYGLGQEDVYDEHGHDHEDGDDGDPAGGLIRGLQQPGSARKE